MFRVRAARCKLHLQWAALLLVPLAHSADDLQSLLAHGSQSLQSGDYANAETCFREALRSNPQSVEILNDLAISLARQNKESEAIQFYRQALKLKPGDPITSRNLAFAYFRSQRYQEALPTLKSFADAWPGFQIDSITGLTLFGLDRYPEAATYLERASQFQPRDLPTLDMLGKAYLKARDYDRVVDVFTRIMAIDPDSPAAHMTLGMTYDKLNREPEAESQYLAAIKVASNYLGAHSALGQVYLREGKRDQAMEEFHKELRNYPEDLVSNSEIGALLRKQNRPAEAIPYLEKALHADPNYKDALFEFGKSKMMLNSPREAIEPLGRAVKLYPDFYQAHFVLGAALRKLGHEKQGAAEQALAEKIQLASRDQDIKNVSLSKEQ
jgi:tetratricopeptide (TPR) repeat protein